MDYKSLHAGYDQEHDKLTGNKNAGESRLQNEQDAEEEHCHADSAHGGIDKVARRKLIVASILCLVFMIGEATGGAFAHSLAIMTDAAHLLTDFASFLISLFAVFLAGRPATKAMSFGWYRAEVVGALVSVLMIWLVTGILVYLAIMRIIHGEYEIDGKVMLITSAVGVGVNILMAVTLHQHGHTHGGSQGHNHSDGNDHGHSHGIISKLKKKVSTKLSGSSTSICDVDAFRNGLKNNYTEEKGSAAHGHSHALQGASSLSAGHVHKSGDSDPEGQPITNDKEKENINVRAAFIHVIGDLLQSIGVLIAAFVIYFKPEYKIADPICTFIFSVLVLLTTMNILKDTMNILMEGTPKWISFMEVRQALYDLPGIVEVHNLRIWSLTINKTAVSVHLAISDLDTANVLQKKANKILRKRFLIDEVTIQIEQYVPSMAECSRCQELKD